MKKKIEWGIEYRQRGSSHKWKLSLTGISTRSLARRNRDLLPITSAFEDHEYEYRIVRREVTYGPWEPSK